MSENAFTKQVLNLVKKDWGEGIAVSGAEFLSKPPRIIPFSPAANLALNGGIPEGSWVTLYGKEKLGKTTSALHFAAKCQKPKHGSKHIYYLNVEGRIKEMNLRGIDGLKTDADNFTLISSTEDHILSAQDFLNIGEKILLNHKECVLIIDSYSMLCHEKEITDGVGTSTRGGGAALLAQFCRQMAGVVPVKRSIVIGISQIMANTSGYGAAIQEKGGNAIRYQVDVKMRCKSAEEWEERGKRVGQKVTWVTECSALGASPGQEFVSCLRYGHGLDEVAEIIMLGTDLGLISKGGAYYYCDFMQTRLPSLGETEWTEEVRKGKCRGHGEAGLYELIKSNPEWIEFLEKDIATMLGVK
jgi:recombination protein RecA